VNYQRKNWRKNSMRYTRLLMALAVLSLVLAPALATSTTCSGGAKCSSSQSSTGACGGSCLGCSCSGSQNSYSFCNGLSYSSTATTFGRSTVGFRGRTITGIRHIASGVSAGTHQSGRGVSAGTSQIGASSGGCS